MPFLGIDNAAAGGMVAEHLLGPGHHRPTAVFAVTDVLALAVLEAADLLGLAVPWQLSVVSSTTSPRPTGPGPP